jgi:hypothetical protein
MITTFFVYSLGAIGGLFALGFISLAYSYAKLVVDTKKLRYEREVKFALSQEGMLKVLMATDSSVIRAPKPAKPNPEDDPSWEILKKMISKSPDHPEIAEIEADDSIIGVFFEGNAYPPELN